MVSLITWHPFIKQSSFDKGYINSIEVTAWAGLTAMGLLWNYSLLYIAFDMLVELTLFHWCILLNNKYPVLALPYVHRVNVNDLPRKHWSLQSKVCLVFKCWNDSKVTRWC